MTTVDFIKQALDFAHRALADARNGTEEQLHFVPAGGSHSIAWCLWHTARVEDLITNAMIQGKPPIWNADWAARTGLPEQGFGTGQSDEEAQAVRIRDMDAFAQYQETVWKATDGFLEKATEADLERILEGPRGKETVAQAISLHVLGHFNGHRGEINFLRGLQGMPTVLATEGTH